MYSLSLNLVSQWIASKSCPSASCAATSGRLYDSSSSQSTGVTFTVQYLSGTVSGPIVWDQLQIGGYIIPDQALGQPVQWVFFTAPLTSQIAAATSVDNEPLSYNFDGILGLSLPSNSLIQQVVPSTDDAPNGATISSNLFSLMPTTDAPSQPFFSLTLGRPGFTQIPSLLGIGLHPSEIVPDPSQIRYSSVVSDSADPLFWMTTVRAITVYVNGHAYPVALQSLSGAPEPTALLDSGVPLIITTPTLANGIYGALGIGPAPDGNCAAICFRLDEYSHHQLVDYVPCATPLNMTITLDGQNELPLHPLDLTTEPAGQSDSQYCTGLIQTDPSKLTSTSGIGDIILGVPFMRNVYTVMAYEQPDASGKFNTSVQFGTYPMLGLFGLTNATQALEEFEQVRVLKQPVGSGTSQPSSGSQSDGSRISVGVKVLIGLVGFFVLCVALFALRYFFARRRLRNVPVVEKAEEGLDQDTEYGGYRRTRRDSRSSFEQTTLVNNSSLRKDNFSPDHGYGLEFGVRKSKLGNPSTELDECDPWDPYAGTWRDTIIGTEAGEATSLRSSYSQPHDLADVDLSSPHESPKLTSALLMPGDSNDSQTNDAAEFGMYSVGMAGIGTAARGSIIDAELPHSLSSYDSVKSSTPLRLTASSLRFSHTLTSPRESVNAASNSDRTF